MDENRRNRLDLNTPAELAIYNAMGEVEKIGAEERLTNALIKLKEAKELVANFVEGIGLSQLPPEKTESVEEINRVMDYLEGKIVSGMELSEALEISELLLILNKYISLPAKQSYCNHVIGANDESGKCLKCGETVSITTRYEKRES